MRLVRDAVLRSVQGESTVIAVVSSLPDEGKSRICLELADSLSGASLRTLLVDGDLRQPTLMTLAAAKMELTQSKLGLAGIGSALEGTPMDREVIRCKPNFDLLPAFRVPNARIDLLTGKAMVGLLREARKSYQFIIVDTPPLAVVSEGAALAAMTDQTLFVSRGTGPSSRLIGDSLIKLRIVRASVLGLVHTGRLFIHVEVDRSKRARAYYLD
jgi:Mrp family chromosome partitioning ATPase